MELDFIRAKLKEIKEEQGINFNYFAKQIGIKESSFYNFTSGKRGLSEKRQKLLEIQIRRFEKNVFFQ